MSKLIMTVDQRFPQSTLVKRFVLETDKIVGLVEDSLGVQVTFKVVENVAPQSVYVTESFDEIADNIIAGQYVENYANVD